MRFSNNKRYNDYSSFIKRRFSERVQKISLDTGFTCPNRDGTKGRGGCTYCNNNSFNPNYCKPDKSITQQLDEGISFFSKKYKTQRYLAYFQAYTNTYADINLVKQLYNEAVNHPQVIGLVIGTRPDCINEDLINFLSELSKDYFISLEFGVESTLDRTLKDINRCHSYKETVDAYQLAKNKGLHLGAHMIIGLPGETKDDILNHAIELSKLPINSLKLHHLQIVKHTMMAHQFKTNPTQFSFYSVEEYIDLITEFVGLLRPDIIIERFISQSPKHLLIAPNWNLKNYEIVDKIDKKLIEKNLWQGKQCLL
ncbi:TIGR01212 family radical SAM protein [Winogradskyella litoriviva]|uniref:TIGR01212 family radical SAM protein n=1 Tax=Winogradskyella litoriviva TaxID=1220182 RepID=A0ABX2E8W3_9FLAO|nr:TIGR01212 family radical SAM protein [Winogradskyella litoriviva]NRD24670.1 TIGR01212 family radical SAM protein [Winogradskyella litoriviva]